MVASSEQQSAPVIVIKPETAQARSNQPGAPINRADSADVMKMPDPIIEPITIMVASIGPRARKRPLCRCLSFIWKTWERELLRLPSQDAPAARVQILPLPVCHRGRKSSPHEHRYLRYRSIELCPPAAFASRVRQIPSDR